MLDCFLSSLLFLLVRMSYLTFPAGERSFPAARLEEVIFVLRELARLKIHPNSAAVLPLNPYLKDVSTTEGNNGIRAHLFVLHPSLCELVISR